MHFKEIVAFLQDFENKNKTTLLDTEFNGWNTWQVIKKPIYNQLRNSYKIKNKQSTKSSKPKYTHIINLLKYSYALLKCLFYKRKANFLFSVNVGRIKVSNNYFYNPFIDPLIEQRIIKKYVYFESFVDGIAKKPMSIKYDVNNNGKKLLIKGLSLFLKKNKEIFKATEVISNLFFEYKELNIQAPNISKNIIQGFLINYYADYLWHKFLLKLFQPKNIFDTSISPSWNGYVLIPSMKVSMSCSSGLSISSLRTVSGLLKTRAKKMRTNLAVMR